MSLTAGIFVAAFLAGCVLAFARHPVYGLATYIATFFLSPQLRWWGEGLLYNVRWALIAAGVTLLAIMVSKKAPRPALPLMSHGLSWLFLMFVAWIGVQSIWALDAAEHSEFFSYYLKFALAILLIYYCVDSETSVRILLWTLVGGCFYFGWIAFTTYIGGRFEGFGGAGIAEANAGALTLATGILAASSLFLAGTARDKAILIGAIPFILNGLVTTISRSGFLALAAGGLIFLYFTPTQHRKRVRVLSILAVVLFLMLTGPNYWQRMQSLEHAGEDVQGVDTGTDRIAIVHAQWHMFTDHPFGCGATCTTFLSRQYIADKYLAVGSEGKRERASHNTFMTMLVDHGVPGALFYVGMQLWVLRKLLVLGRAYRKQTGFLATAFPAIAGGLVAITVGDMFVTYAKLEIRIWYLAVLMALLSMDAARLKQEHTTKSAATAGAAVVRVPRPQQTQPRSG